MSTRLACCCFFFFSHTNFEWKSIEKWFVYEIRSEAQWIHCTRVMLLVPSDLRSSPGHEITRLPGRHDGVGVVRVNTEAAVRFHARGGGRGGGRGEETLTTLIKKQYNSHSPTAGRFREISPFTRGFGTFYAVNGQNKECFCGLFDEVRDECTTLVWILLLTLYGL